MKVSDLLNVLAHLPGELEVDATHLELEIEGKVIAVEHALANILSGKHVATPPAEPV